MRRDAYPGTMEFERPKEYLVEAASEASETHPDCNEDAYFMLTNGAVGVFDGVGGYEGSHQASALVAECCRDTLVDVDLFNTPDEVCRQLTSVLRQANRVLVRAYGHTRYDIATTAILAAITTDPRTREQHACLAHAGDSRGSVYRNGAIVATTLDHSLASVLDTDEQRRIQDEISRAYYTHEVDPFYWPYVHERNVVTSYLNAHRATSALAVDTMTVPVQQGDIVLLTSDGIHDNLTTDEICRILQTASDPTRELIEAAQIRSHSDREVDLTIDDTTHRVHNFRSKYDDMTATIIYC